LILEKIANFFRRKLVKTLTLCWLDKLIKKSFVESMQMPAPESGGSFDDDEPEVYYDEVEESDYLAEDDDTFGKAT
jgi:hypothetical protein